MAKETKESRVKEEKKAICKISLATLALKTVEKTLPS